MSNSTDKVLDTAAVAKILGLATATVTRYLTESRRVNGRYYTHPFPIPDGFISGAPYWLSHRAHEIEAWSNARPGKGSGGGRPPRREKK